jgi:hypothetical protein
MSVATPADVANILALDDEQIAELQKGQQKALDTFRSKARLTPEERQLGYGIEMERHHRQTVNKDALAEALAMQGRFVEAADIAEREDLKNVLAEKAEAILKDDANCECPNHTEDSGFHIPNQYVESYAISHKHDGKIMPLIRCRVCGDLNARAMPAHLAEQRAARAASVAGKEVSATQFFREAR